MRLLKKPAPRRNILQQNSQPTIDFYINLPTHGNQPLNLYQLHKAKSAKHFRSTNLIITFNILFRHNQRHLIATEVNSYYLLQHIINIIKTRNTAQINISVFRAALLLTQQQSNAYLILSIFISAVLLSNLQRRYSAVLFLNLQLPYSAGQPFCLFPFGHALCNPLRPHQWYR